MLNYIKGLPEKLARVTSGGKHIREVDGLRFLAIFPVVVLHLNERFIRDTSLVFSNDLSYEIISFFVGRGFIGIYIFFVISGFILGLPFASHHINQTKSVNLRSYYWRRITRLEPPYIISLVVFFIILLNFKGNNFNELFPHFLSSFFYLHNIIYFHYTPINPPAWTLEIEVQFYLLAPFFATLFFQIKNSNWRKVILIFVIVMILIIQSFFSLMTTRVLVTVLGHIQYFLIGFIFADIFLVNWKEEGKNNKFLDFVAILAFVALFFSWSWDYKFMNMIIFCFLLFLLFYSSFKSCYFNKFLKNRWITAIGGMCYSIYLIHLPLAELIILFSKSISFTDNYLLNLIIQLLIYLPILFIISVIFYLTIEKPCMEKNWPEKIVNKARKLWYKAFAF